MRLAETLHGEPEIAAPGLLGSYLVSTVGEVVVKMRITEVEAYKGSEDPASHAFRGPTPRNRSMFQRPGTLYVYRSYGVHYCANASAGPEGIGWGILIRGGEIVDGLGHARRRRGRQDSTSNGPGKVCQAMGIEIHHDGHYLLDRRPPLWLEPGDTPDVILTTPRVGVSRARDLAWRFVVPL